MAVAGGRHRGRGLLVQQRRQAGAASSWPRRPADATVLVDNVKVGDHSPVSIERPPGPYTLSVTRDGYARNDQNIELQAGQPLSLTVALEPSPDTGFELTSDPPGGLVWLDGAPSRSLGGSRRAPNFRASRIAPGTTCSRSGARPLQALAAGRRDRAGRDPQDSRDADPRRGRAGARQPAPRGPRRARRAGREAERSRRRRRRPTPPPRAECRRRRREAARGRRRPPPPAAGAAHVPVAAHRRPRPRRRSASAARGAAPTRRPRRRPTTRAAQDGVATDEAGGGDCSITVNSIPWSEVWIDGKNTSKHTPVVDYKVPCGKHKLAFKRPDMQIDQTESINVRPGQNFKQRYTLATEE